MDIIKKVTKDAERLLKSLKAEYYIKLPTGEIVTAGFAGQSMQANAPEKAPRKKREAVPGREVGALSAHFRPEVEKCVKAGDIAVVQTAGFKIEDLRSALAAWCSVNWGKNTYTTSMNRDKGQVEVMRLADAKPTKKQAESKVNGSGGEKPKFHTVGHGLDALKTLTFDDEPK